MIMPLFAITGVSRGIGTWRRIDGCQGWWNDQNGLVIFYIVKFFELGTEKSLRLYFHIAKPY